MATISSEHMQPVTATSSAAVAQYDSAVASYLTLSGDPVANLTSAIKSDPSLVMAHVLNAALHLLSTAITADFPVVAEARQAIKAAVSSGNTTPRERAAGIAIEALAAGRWRFAAAVIEAQLAREPMDAILVRLAHDIYFFLGDSKNLRDGVARVFPCWDPTAPGYSRLCGMLAFGFEEMNHYDRAEEMAMTALNMDPQDAWATHAATHVYEMMGRKEEGERLLKETEDQWGEAALFARHIQWHWALFSIGHGTSGARQAMGRYDRAIAAGGAAQMDALTLVDATSLLWRMELLTHPLQLHPVMKGGSAVAPPSRDTVASAQPDAGAGAGGTTRWQVLARHWEEVLKPQAGKARLNVFNDIHAAMAYSVTKPAGESKGISRGEALMAEVRSVDSTVDADWLSRSPWATATLMELGIDAAQPDWQSMIERHDQASISQAVGGRMMAGMAAFWRATASGSAAEYREAYDCLRSTRAKWQIAGGSHAQRDIFEQTLIHAAVGANLLQDAAALCSERVVNRPNDGQAWFVFGSVLKLLASSDVVVADSSKADQLNRRVVDCHNRAYVLGVNQGPGY